MARKFNVNILGNFGRHQKSIFTYVRKLIDGYFDHNCYTILQNRMSRLDNSIDMKSARENRQRSRNNQWHRKNQWNSKIYIPYGHESYLLNKAMLNRSFSADPLISFEPIGSTPWENSVNAQDTLAQNLHSTRFRERVFNNTITKMAARYGSVPVISTFQHRPQRMKRTVNGPLGLEQREITEHKQNVINTPINPLNYFQHPAIADPEESDYRGWLQRWNLSALINVIKAEKELYIKENVEKVIKEAKTDAMNKSENYSESDPRDFHTTGVDIEHIYTTLPIEGNEDDETIYYLELAGDSIIRIQDNPNDFNIVPIAIYGLDKRLEYWWSNTPPEKTFPTENYANILLSLTADNIFRANQNYVFYPEGKVDIAAINDRHKNGGFIPVEEDILRNFKTPFFPWQRQELSTSATQYMMSEMKEVLQRTQSKPDVSRQGLTGGPKNTTATAFEGLQDQASALQFDIVSEFAGGLKTMGRNDIILLQQRLDDRFNIRPNIKEAPRELHKMQILGDFLMKVESALTKNTQLELAKYQNALTWVMNMQGTGHPDFQNINVGKLFKSVVKKFDLDVDADEIIPEAQAVGQPGQPVALPGQQPGQAGPGDQSQLALAQGAA